MGGGYVNTSFISAYHKSNHMHLTDNPEKMAIVDRLVKEGVIDFTEAIKLLEKEDVPVVRDWTIPLGPSPYTPWDGTAITYVDKIDLASGPCNTSVVMLTQGMLASASYTN